MEAEIYRAALKGDERILDGRYDQTKLQALTSGKNNTILHVAATSGQEGFIREALKLYPDMIKLKNLDGDTPLHVVARHDTTEAVAEFLCSFKVPETGNGNGNGEEHQLWLVSNQDGNTPLHVALRHGNIRVAIYLSTLDERVFRVLNHSDQTPLHLLITCCDGNWPIPISKDALPHNRTLNLEGGTRSKTRTLLIQVDEQLESILVRFLSYKAAASMCDADGLTPLLRAAHIGCFRALKIILQHCPESAEVTDPDGKTVLHHVKLSDYQELTELLKFPEIDVLKNVRDFEGNTPLFLAAEKGEFLLTRVLRESFFNSRIKDKVDTINKTTYRVMDTQLYVAAVEGKVNVFDKRNNNELMGYVDDYFLSRTTNGSTILHLGIENDHLEFVKETLMHFPTLLVSRDHNGETPAHIVARLKTPAAELMLQSFVECHARLNSEWKNLSIYHCYTPWRVKNVKGNSALHEAMRTSNYNILPVLINIDPYLSLATNDSNETPLHVFARYGTYAAEDKLEVLDRVLRSCPYVGYVKDEDGFTPLLRAAQSGRIRLAILIANKWIQAIKVCDSKGRNILHHLKIIHLELVDESEDIGKLCEEIFRIPGVDNLRSAQDQDGNTPLHFAVKTGNIATAKLLLQRCLESEVRDELTIMDNDGISFFDLLASQGHNHRQARLLHPTNHLTPPSELEQTALLSMKYVKELTRVEKMMDEELHNAAVAGDVEVLDKRDIEGGPVHEDAYFQTRTPDGANVIHIALQPGKADTSAFIKEALDRFPALLLETDSHGDTPAHLAAKWPTPASTKLLENLDDYYLKARGSNRAIYIPPWRVKNSRGNMPIHEALCSNHWSAADILLDIDETELYINGADETPLHVFARCGLYEPTDELCFLETLIRERSSAAFMRDKNGLTPLLRAAKCGRTRVAQAILKHCPKSAQLRDPNGRTVLHLLHFTGVEFFEGSSNHIFKIISKQFFEIREVDVLRLVQDYDGNLPLHYAIKTKNWVTAQVLAARCFETPGRFELTMVNNEKEKLEDLIAAHEAPDEIVGLFRKKMPTLNTSWFRSSYGIRESEIKDSAGKLSVVAALLATITFGAAFQVPGGFNSSDGSPVLLTSASFKVFLLSDTSAMSCSMAVLFLLLWVMATGKTRDSFKLLDLSIFLLQLSFYATLVAFMTGVYAATAHGHETKWLAIFVCALCSTVALISWKTAILFFIRIPGLFNSMLYAKSTN